MRRALILGMMVAAAPATAQEVPPPPTIATPFHTQSPERVDPLPRATPRPMPPLPTSTSGRSGENAVTQAQGSRGDFYNATTSWSHNEAVSLRWRPNASIEILPFWARSQVYDDEAGPTSIPAGPYLPPKVQSRRFDGPRWSDYNSIAGLQGLLVSITPASNWLVRAGVFRSLHDDRSTFANLLTDVTPDGSARVYPAETQTHQGR